MVGIFATKDDHNKKKLMRRYNRSALHDEVVKSKMQIHQSEGLLEISAAQPENLTFIAPFNGFMCTQKRC